MAADDLRAVLVPMVLDAFQPVTLANSSGAPHRLRPSPNEKARAYLAPLNPPNLAALQLQSSLIQHDIFEQLRITDLVERDVSRADTVRRGFYLHWSLPRPYRAAAASSSSAGSAAALDAHLVRGGFRASRATATEPVPPQRFVFRQVPTRWIVVRQLGDGDSSKPLELRDGDSESAERMQLPPGTQRRWVFVVESDRVRDIDEVPPGVDILNTAAPLIDDKQPLARQGQMWLGQTHPVAEWPGDSPDTVHDAHHVPLTVARTANPFFADYQPHNSSIFSFFDNMTVEVNGKQWLAGPGPVSYVVVGYHSTTETDPLGSTTSDQQHIDRLKACLLQMKDLQSLSNADLDWLKAAAGPGMVTICHGAMFDLPWYSLTDWPSSIPKFTPADIIQRGLLNQQGISVGTNAIDALFGWLRSQVAPDGSSTADDVDFMERQLLRLQTFVMDFNEDIDSHLEASDLLATNNFIPTPAGSRWHFKKSVDTSPTDKEPLPTADQLSKLRDLNEMQNELDFLLRQNQRLKTELFELWWTYVADRDKLADGDRTALRTKITAAVNKVTKTLKQNGAPEDTNSRIGVLAIQIDKATRSLSVEAGAKPPFYIQRDPTFFVAGADSQWSNFAEDLPVRLDGQNLVGVLDSATLDLNNVSMLPPEILTQVQGPLSGKVPPHILNPLLRLLTEAESLRGSIVNGKRVPKPGLVPPEYFPDETNYNDHTGWFPLFLEWEIEYYNIPFEHWTFAPQGSDSRMGYGIKPGVKVADLPDIQGDYQKFHARSPILPQTSASLDAVLRQIFSKINPDDLNKYIPEEDRTTLLKDIKSLKFLSSPMTGLTSQLVTRMPGTHVRPNYLDGSVPKVLQEALDLSKEIGMDAEDVQLMDFDTGFMPFASQVPVTADPSKYSPFKPCTHGQFRFTKLLIVDRFAQVVRSNYLSLQRSDQSELLPAPIVPCRGETYSLDALPDGTANAVLSRKDELTSFVQLPPTINQNARVNFSFLQEPQIVSGNPLWSPIDEWDNPVYGWIIVHVATDSLIILNPDGVAMREFSIRSKSAMTLPFPIDDKIAMQQNPFLRDLLLKMKDLSFATGWIQTILDTANTTQASPTHYADSMLSATGRPLALVKVGISLELADPPLTNQSTLSPNFGVKELSILDYSFNIKIGDGDNIFDGLIGYFDIKSTGDVDLSNFYTYFPPTQPLSGSPSRSVPSDSRLNPFFDDVDDADYGKYKLSNSKVLYAVVDPFTPLHCYTSLLPTAMLTLPPWAVERGLAHAASFLYIGPLLVPSTIPAFNPNAAVSPDYLLGSLDNPPPPSVGSIPVPALGLAEWAWLHPNWVDGSTKYNLLDVVPAKTNPDWGDKVPYSVVEGYLQMKRPLQKPQ